MTTKILLTTLTITLAILMAGCKSDPLSSKVTYKVTGTWVTQFKITNGSTEHVVNVPFAGTKDTTVYIVYGTKVKLDAKGEGTSLQGTIYIDDVLVATLIDNDADGDSKTQVKIDYTIPYK